MNLRVCRTWLGPVAAAAMAVAAMASTSAQAEPGMRVTRDADSGRLRAPTAEENQKLDAAANDARGHQRRAVAERRGMVTGHANPQVRVRANGTKVMELDESTLSYSVARRGADGSTELYCVTGKDSADHLLQGKKIAAKAGTAHQEHDHDLTK